MNNLAQFPYLDAIYRAHLAKSYHTRESKAPGIGYGPFPASIRNRRRFLSWLILVIALTTPATSPARAQLSQSLLISEVYYDTPGTDSEEEWVELTNISNTPLVLSDYMFGDASRPQASEGMVRFPVGATLQPQSTAVVAQTAEGFRAIFGFNPDYEIVGGDPHVPDMLPHVAWSQGDFALNNDGDDVLLLNAEELVIDAVSYGDSTEFMAPSVLDVARGQSIARVPAHCDSNAAGDWRPQTMPTPGAITLEGNCSQAPMNGEDPLLTPIGSIQGNSASSPMVNQTVSFEGIVTGVLEDRNTRGATFYTLFVQQAAGEEDGDPLTSDAIAVFHGARRPSYVAGDRVRVIGQVTEFYGLTEIDDSGLRIELTEAGQPLPAATQLPPMSTTPALQLETLESMRVTVAEAVVVGPTHSSCSFAVVQGRLFQRVVRRHFEDNVDPIIPVLHISDVACGDFPQLKTGDVVHGLEGPLTYHFDQYKIVHQFVEDLTVQAAAVPELPALPQIADGEASVATFNLHDFFDDVAASVDEGDFTPTSEQLAVKQAKLAQTIATVLGCPTVLAVQEVENEALLKGLSRALQPLCSFNYEVAHRESWDARGIDLGLLADSRRVKIGSVEALQRCSVIATDVPETGLDCPAGEDPLFARPPLVVELTLEGNPYTVIVVHFKSKREGEIETAARREAQAQVVNNFVQEQFTRDPHGRIIVLGDLNDYENSPALAALTLPEGGLFNTAGQIALDLRYTYNFAGVSQLLDSILLSPALLPHLVSSHIIHVNADFPGEWAADSQTAFRSSDHDIPLIVLRVDSDTTAETPNATVIPTPVPTIEEAPPIATAESSETQEAAGDETWPVEWPLMTGLILLSTAIVAGAIIGLTRRNR